MPKSETSRRELPEQTLKQALISLDSKISKSGVVTLDSLEKEHAALRSLNKEMYLKLCDELERKMQKRTQKAGKEALLKAKLKNNGTIL